MKWHDGAVATAISESRQKKALFVVVVLHSTEAKNENSIKMERLWDNVSDGYCSQQIVAIRVYEGTEPAKQFAQIYPVPIVPASYLIDLQGRPLDVITVTSNLDDVMFASRLRSAADAMGGVQQAAQQTAASSNVEASPPAAFSTLSCCSIDSTCPLPAAGSQSPTLSVEERAKRARELLEKKHLLDEQKKQQEEKQKELERRNAGKLMAEAKASREERELREAAEQRRREKQESEEQLKRLREQIKADREERRNREHMAKGDASSKLSEKNPPFVQQPIPSEHCRIQCKFPDGRSLVYQLPSSDSFSKLVDLVRKDGKQNDDFYLVQMYPRREFPDTSLSFLELGLTPSATVLVVSKHHSHAVIPTASTGVLRLFNYIVIAPFQALYRFMLYFLGYDGSSRGSLTNSRTSKERHSHETVERSGGYSRQEGNVRRFHNEEDSSKSDDEEARWNGNSTQQL